MEHPTIRRGILQVKKKKRCHSYLAVPATQLSKREKNAKGWSGKMSSSDNDPTSMPDPELPLHTTPEPIGELCGVRSKYTDLWYANPTSKSELWSRRKNTFPTGGVAAFSLVIYSVLLCIYLLYSTPFLFFFFRVPRFTIVSELDPYGEVCSRYLYSCSCLYRRIHIL